MTDLAFPLWYLLIPFAVVALGTSLFLFFNLYHVAKFGIQSLTTTLLLLGYLGTYLAILGASAVLIGSIDWTAQVSVLDILPFAGGSTSAFGL